MHADRRQLPSCPRCQYSLDDLPDTYVCPECGFVYEADMRLLRGWDAQTRPTRTNLNVTLIFIFVLVLLLVRDYTRYGLRNMAFVYGALLTGAMIALISIARNINRERDGEAEMRIIVHRHALALYDAPSRDPEIHLPFDSLRSVRWIANAGRSTITLRTTHGTFGPYDVEASPDVINEVHERREPWTT